MWQGQEGGKGRGKDNYTVIAKKKHYIEKRKQIIPMEASEDYGPENLFNLYSNF